MHGRSYFIQNKAGLEINDNDKWNEKCDRLNSAFVVPAEYNASR